MNTIIEKVKKYRKLNPIIKLEQSLQGILFRSKIFNRRGINGGKKK